MACCFRGTGGANFFLISKEFVMKKVLISVKKIFLAFKLQAFVCAHEMSRVPMKLYFLLMTLASSPYVQAQAAGGLFTGWRGAMNQIISLLVLAATLTGIGAVLYGLVNLVKKGMGRGDDIEWREIIWPLGGGAMLTVLMYVVDGLVVESGSSQADMGVSRGF